MHVCYIFWMAGVSSSRPRDDSRESGVSKTRPQPPLAQTWIVSYVWPPKSEGLFERPLAQTWIVSYVWPPKSEGLIERRRRRGGAAHGEYLTQVRSCEFQKGRQNRGEERYRKDEPGSCITAVCNRVAYGKRGTGTRPNFVSPRVKGSVGREPVPFFLACAQFDGKPL